jgi:aspartyl protease family protein
MLEIAEHLYAARGYTVGGAQQTLAPMVRIGPDAWGRYTTTGRINGVAVGFRVDTESALVRLNAAQAARLGIDFRRTGTRMLVRTASGRAIAYRLRLARVQVGAIQLKGVPAMVIDGAEPATVLLGMSFLGRLRLRHEGRLLILAPVR